MGATRFLPTNYWTEALLTASSETDGLPAAASTNPDRTYVWRSKNVTTDQTLQGTTDSISANMVAIANLKRMNSGAVTLQQAGAGSTPGAWVDVVTLPDPDDIAKVSVAFFTAVTARHWRLYFANGTPAADYAEAGYIGLGTYFEPSRVQPVGYEVPINDPTIFTESIDGQETGTARTPYMATEISFTALNQTDLASVHDLQQAATVRTPIFVVLDLSKPWQWYLGRLRSPLARIPMKGNQYEVRVGFQEAR